MFSPQEKAHSALVNQVEQLIETVAGNTYVDRDIVIESLDYLIEQIKDHLKALKKKKGKAPAFDDYEASFIDTLSAQADDADWDGRDIGGD